MTRSQDCFEAAQHHIPGGVNSPVRAFRAVGGTPVFFARAQGAWLEDVDGNRYLDYVQSWGPMILGHGHPAVLDAIRAQLDRGLGFGAPTELETRMADKVCELVPSMEMVRMVSSGTEATMSAIWVSSSVGAPKLSPLLMMEATASITSWWAWPRIIGPQEPT